MGFYYKILNFWRFLKIPQIIKKIFYKITHLKFLEIIILIILLCCFFSNKVSATENVVDETVDNALEIEVLNENFNEDNTVLLNNILNEIIEKKEIEKTELNFINHLLFLISIFVLSGYIYIFCHCLLERRKL